MAEMRRLAITKEIYADIFDREEGSQLQVELMEHRIVHDPHPEPRQNKVHFQGHQKSPRRRSPSTKQRRARGKSGEGHLQVGREVAAQQRRRRVKLRRGRWWRGRGWREGLGQSRHCRRSKQLSSTF
jgi:hypothetical protein